MYSKVGSLRIRTQSLLLGTALLAGAGAAAATISPAFANDALSPVTVTAANVQFGDYQGILTATGDAAAGATVETVVVTGYRASLEQAAVAKRNNVNFTDSVFAEDIGKFPDTNIAESLNRIPGVTISRDSDGEGVNVSDPRPRHEFHQDPAEQRPDRGGLHRPDRSAEQQPRSRSEHVPHGLVHPVDGQQEPDRRSARRRRRRHREHAQRASLRQAGPASDRLVPGQRLFACQTAWASTAP